MLLLPSLALAQDDPGASRKVAPLLTLLPPLLAILLAIWLRQVILALAAGVFVGAWILSGNPIDGFLMGIDEFIVGAVADHDNAAVILFTLILGGMVGTMARSGGTHGIVDSVSGFIKGARSGQIATSALGFAIFFDDYANTLLVGNTMRPVSDRVRVSREKLAYLVDSTAAPVTTIALLSTWVGYQIGLIRDGLEVIGGEPNEAYATFFSSIPYSSYSWFALALVIWVASLGRDFGPMLSAERRARSGGGVLRDGATPLADDIGSELYPPEGTPRRAHHAVIPILLVLVATIVGLYLDGRASLLAEAAATGQPADLGLRAIFSNGDPFMVLLWAVVLGAAVAILLPVSQRVFDLNTAMSAWTSGAKAMLPALIILVLAFAIRRVCDGLGTADVVVDAATGNLSARLVPTVIFLVAAFLGFSTGTSWGTMAILMPIAIPLAHQLPADAGLTGAAASGIFLSSIACVLSGSVLGDHCSPISDTTIMSSMASGADHVDHVRTQLPYALTAGSVAIILGTIPAGFGISPLLTLPLGMALLGLVVWTRGRSAENPV